MKFISYPVKPFFVAQGFGDNNVCYDPATKKVSSKINNACVSPTVGFYAYYGLKGHNGLDCPVNDSQPLFCPFDGVVEEVETEASRGLGLGIVSKQEFDGKLWKVRPWHLKGMNVSKGQEVKAGDLLGWCDNTGYSTGTHLHMELKPVAYENGVLKNLEQDNGYFGAVDPTPYFDGFFAQDVQTIISLQYALIELYKKVIALLTNK